MVRNVAIVYDDTRKPGREIAVITGNKSFGETIYKRQTLRERVAGVFCRLPYVTGFYDKGARELANIKNTHVILYYSDFGIAKTEGLETIVYKAGYAHENYKITHNNRIACVIFKDENAYFTAAPSDYDTYTEIVSDAFTDMSEVGNFRSFITGGFDARFFNSLTGDEYTVVKSSPKKNKIKAEYTFYSLLPDDMKQWFVRPFDYSEDEANASYRMQRYSMTDLAIRYVHGSIRLEEFKAILGHLFYFLSHRKAETVTGMEYEAEAKRLYVSKVYERIGQLKEDPQYHKIARLIEALTPYSDIDGIVARYVNLYDKIRSGMTFEHIKCISHGDMCFSNILYSNSDSLLKMVDPKGAMTEEELYMDPYYDVAKLSHSVCGYYDYFNSDLFEITVDSNMTARVRVDADNRQYVELFRDILGEYGMDLVLIRLYEASLFLSMLPLHMDRPQKVFGFIINALAILDSLEK